MKRLALISLTLFLLLTQWASIVHAYHEHNSDEVCDFCLNSHSLDHGVITTHQSILPYKTFHFQPALSTQFLPASAFRYYSPRAPPVYPENH